MNIDKYKKLITLVHKNNANIIMQLVHTGATTTTNIDRPYAPSQIKDTTTKKITKEFSKDDILRIEDDFVKLLQLEPKNQVLMMLKFMLLIYIY